VPWSELTRVRYYARRLATVEARRQRDIERRDDAIRAASAAGHSLREIGEVAGLTHTAVRKITRHAPPTP
jgi:hypothetical protein